MRPSDRTAGVSDQLWDGEVGPPHVAAAIAQWEQLWGLPDFARTLTVTFSPRLRRALGRSTPSNGRITLHPALREGPTGRLLEVLCHEAAHVAAARRAQEAGARRPVAHGIEWAELVRAAGYIPAVRAPLPPSTETVRRGTTRARPAPTPRVLHTCPVCHTERLARRAVPTWRCAECVAAGLDGRLVVTRRGGARS